MLEHPAAPHKNNQPTQATKTADVSKKETKPADATKKEEPGSTGMPPELLDLRPLEEQVKIDHKEFPNSWFKNVPEKFFLSRRYCASTNKYGVKSGQDQAAWEMAGWMREQDPRGWFQWYCRFYQGRRSPDDARQIQRWKACAGFLGRWRNQLCSRINGSGRTFDDAAVAPVIRQTLLHWAYELTEYDWELWFTRG
ncbi:unnamed protein product [Symbiodinium sp. CCMP2592]|nr:unnamed protein product [Symbiodinium sp. CCMP2592]